MFNRLLSRLTGRHRVFAVPLVRKRRASARIRLTKKYNASDVRRKGTNKERDIIMLKLLQEHPNETQVKDISFLSFLFGSVVLIVLISATLVVPAHAQGVPAGLLRLDAPQPTNDGVKLAERGTNDGVMLTERGKLRNAYARSQKPRAN